MKMAALKYFINLRWSWAVRGKSHTGTGVRRRWGHVTYQRRGMGGGHVIHTQENIEIARETDSCELHIMAGVLTKALLKDGQGHCHRNSFGVQVRRVRF